MRPVLPGRLDAASEDELRTAFFRRAGRYTPLVAVDHAGVRFLVSTEDRALGLKLFVRKRRNDATTLARALVHLDRRGIGARTRDRVFLDVGANIGTTS